MLSMATPMRTLSLQLYSHFAEQRLIGQLHDGPARSPTACGKTAARRHRGVCQQVVPQAFYAVEFRSIHHFGARVRSTVPEVAVTSPPDCVKTLQREAESINSLMTMVTLGIGVGVLGELAHGEVSVVSSSGSFGTSLGGLGSFTKQGFGHQLPRRMGLVLEAPIASPAW